MIEGTLRDIIILCSALTNMAICVYVGIWIGRVNEQLRCLFKIIKAKEESEERADIAHQKACGIRFDNLERRMQNVNITH